MNETWIPGGDGSFMKQHNTHVLSVLLFALLSLALFALPAFAVPAAPGSIYTGEEALCRSHAGKLITLNQLPDRVPGGARRVRRPGETTKDIPLLTLVIGFRDVPYRDDYDWADEIFRQSESLRAFYTDMSFGKFTFDPVKETSAYRTDGNTNTADKVNDGVIHVKLNRNHENWTGVGLLQTSVALRDLSMAKSIHEALEKASDYMDFAQYDTNKDGEISTDELALAFVFAGYEASAIDEDGFIYGVGKYLWAHAWSIEEMIEGYGWNSRRLTIPKPDGVAVSSYIAIAEQLKDGEREPISVLAHELGHYLGLPDLYNTVYDENGPWSGFDVGSVSVMASGSWGINPAGGYVPYSMDAWSRYVLGWIKPTEAKTDGNYNVISQSYGAAAQDFAVVRIETQTEGEYYLLENRQLKKWDAGLAAEYEGASLTSGIILWHVDMNAFEQYADDNAVNNPDHRPAVMPLYPEVSGDDKVSFVSKDGDVFVGNPFFDKSFWNKGFSTLGRALDLPLYGRDGKADDRGARQTSGIKVQFTSNSAHKMTIKLDTSAKKHFHTWKADKILVKPTCTTPGEQLMVCTGCGVSEKGVAEALGHDIGDNGVCTRCGKAFCPLCKGEHTGFFGGIVGFFHRIIWRMTHLF